MSITRKKLANILPIGESDVTNLVTDLASKVDTASFTYNSFTYSGTFSLPAILQTMILVPTVSTDAFKLPSMTADAWTLNRPFLIINSTNTSAKIQLFDASSLTIMDPYEVIEVICTDKSTSNGTFVIVDRYLLTTGSYTAFLRKSFDLSDVPDPTIALFNLGGEAAAWTINAQTGTTYTLTANDFVNTLVTFNNASAITVTIPQTSTATIAAGKKTRCLNLGAGTVTFALQGTDTKTGNSTLTTGAICEIEKIIAGTPNTYNIAGGTATQTFTFTGYIQTVANQSYNLALSMPFAGTVTNTITKSESGTATGTFKINTTAMGGTANSISSTRQTQAQSSANTFGVGDDLVLTVSANSSCVGIGWAIQYTRTF